MAVFVVSYLLVNKDGDRIHHGGEIIEAVSGAEAFLETSARLRMQFPFEEGWKKLDVSVVEFSMEKLLDLAHKARPRFLSLSP